MATKVEKFSVSLAPETIAQMEFIKENYMHIDTKIARSQLIAACISIAYYEVINRLDLF